MLGNVIGQDVKYHRVMENQDDEGAGKMNDRDKWDERKDGLKNDEVREDRYVRRVGESKWWMIEIMVFQDRGQADEQDDEMRDNKVEK